MRHYWKNGSRHLKAVRTKENSWNRERENSMKRKENEHFEWQKALKIKKANALRKLE